jgi:hypothetical protein
MIDIISRTQSITRDDSADLADVRRELQRAARLEARGDRVVVSFSLTFAAGRVYGSKQPRPVTIDLYRDRGIAPSRVIARWDDEDSLRIALMALARRRQDIESLSELISVEMLLTPPRPDTRQRAA